MDKPSNDLIQTPNPALRETLKRLVVDSVTALESKRAYGSAIDKFLDWFEQESPASGFNKAAVQRYRTKLVNMKLSSSTVSLHLTAIRRLAAEAADNGLLASDLAMGVSRVKSVKRHGLRLGNWLTLEQADKLLNTPDASSLKGKRDRALLGILLGCGLRRNEAACLDFERIQQREGRWVIIDMLGKGRRVRSIPIPEFAMTTVNTWTQAAALSSGRVFRSVNKSGRLSGESMAGQAVFEVVKQYTAKNGFPGIGPHHLRRSYARLAHLGKSSLEQIQLSLGHFSVSTTEAYVGVQQTLADAPCDHLGLGQSGPPSS